MTDAKQAVDLGDYVLDRTLFSGIRLNCQHFLRTRERGYLIHPSIHLSDDASVADIGTGTAIWLIDLADTLPSTVNFWGCDISMSQTPPKEWLPGNVKLEQLDITKPIPDELAGKFDLVHLSLFMLVLQKDEEVLTVLRNMVRMLKPGGWLQWQEAIRAPVGDILKASPDSPSSAHIELLELVQSMDKRLTPVTWMKRLDEFFKIEGLQQVASDNRKTASRGAAWVAYCQETVLAVAMEIHSRMPPSDMRERLGRLVVETGKEVKQGTVWAGEQLLYIGKKPL